MLKVAVLAGGIRFLAQRLEGRRICPTEQKAPPKSHVIFPRLAVGLQHSLPFSLCFILRNLFYSPAHMSATAEAKQPSRRAITVITQKNLPAHLRQTKPYDSLLSAESSPLLSPPPPYQQFEQGSEYNVCLC